MAVAAVAMLAFLPSKWSAWESSLSGIVKLAVAPVSGPVRQATGWFVREGGAKDSELTKQLERERDHFKWLWLQELRETENLKKTVEQLQKGQMLNELPVAQLVRPVIGTSSDGRGGLLEIRAGSGQGVSMNDIATTEGVQIVGKVVGVNARTCTVRVLTGTGAGGITGVVMTDDEKPGAVCSLYPYKGSLLQGQVAYSPKETRPQPVVGQTVRLEDSQWPKHAQRLVIGVVTDVRTVTTGRQVIEVKPTVDLDRLSEVVLRLTPKDSDERMTTLPAGKSTGDGRP
jgi:cell shape-determining protein MreC